MDAERASKCYQKAVSLNPDDSEVGVSELEFPFQQIELKLASFGAFVF